MIIVNETLANGGPGQPFEVKSQERYSVTILTLAGSAVVERLSDKDQPIWVPVGSGVSPLTVTEPVSFVLDAVVSGSLFRVNQTSGTGMSYRVDR